LIEDCRLKIEYLWNAVDLKWESLANHKIFTLQQSFVTVL